MLEILSTTAGPGLVSMSFASRIKSGMYQRSIQINLCKPKAIHLPHFIHVNQTFQYWQIYDL